MTDKNILLQVQDLQQAFKKGGAQPFLVLDNLNLTIKSGEIVALLGKSGSGKSTLLRIISGLLTPTHGSVFIKGEVVDRPRPEISMVFQNFALLPWLTVLENVMLGLEARGVPKAERRQRALKTIDIVGLDGFESAYPKELSGGMCQRVGFARALVVDPEILMLDEAFSALDVLTAENLRGDLINIWQSVQTNIRSIIVVTHNIEEAIVLADRVLIFANNPGYIQAEIEVNLPRPRNDEHRQFQQLVNHIYTLMTSSSQAKNLAKKQRVIGLDYRLPSVEISEITGLIESLATYEPEGRVDLPVLAEDLHFDVDDLFPITEALELLEFAKTSKGDIALTDHGKQFASADILEKKKIFAKQLLNCVPLARHIRRVLDERPEHSASEKRFLNELEDYLDERLAEEILRIVIDWSRYAELFAYDFNTGILSFENPQ